MVEPLLLILIFLLIAFLLIDGRSSGVLQVVIAILVIALLLRLLGVI